MVNLYDVLEGPSPLINSRLGSVVLATGPKSREFKSGQDDGFLRAIKIRNIPSFG
jgi:hypothetical protein